MGRPDIGEITAFFESKRLINTDLEAYKRDQSRAIIERDRKRQQRKGLIQLELVNIRQVGEDGGQERNYFCPFGELTSDERRQLIAQWTTRCHKSAARLYRYLDAIVEDEPNFVQGLWFDLPPRPPAGIDDEDVDDATEDAA